MKVFLSLLGVLTLALVLACAVTLYLYPTGFSFPHGNIHFSGHPNPFGLAWGLMVAGLAVVFALVMAAFAVVGALLAVFFALVLTGLILLAVAVPFSLPLIVPLVLIFIVVMASRRSNRARTA